MKGTSQHVAIRVFLGAMLAVGCGGAPMEPAAQNAPSARQVATLCTDGFPVHVFEPTSGSTHFAGDPLHLYWDYSLCGGSVPSFVRLELYKGDVFQSTIRSSVSTFQHEDDWLIPVTLPEGTDYRIRISDAENPTNGRFSRAFTITARPCSRPIPCPGLQLWLNPMGLIKAGGRVTEWRDHSASGNHAKAPTGRQPYFVFNALAGEPVLRFTGAELMYLTRTLPLPQYTLFVVAKNSMTTQVLSPILGSSTTGSSSQELRFEGSSVVALVNTNIISASVGDTRVYHALSLQQEGSVVTLFRDGTPATSGPSMVGLQLGLVGSRDGSLRQGLQGDIVEIIAYDRALSETERATVNSYLRDRYALP